MDTTSANYTEAYNKFANWIEETKKKLSSCHCCDGTKQPLEWKNVINYHKSLQNEVEVLGETLKCKLKQHLNEDKSHTKEQIDQTAELEGKWHQLWLKHLEQLVVVERTRRCPIHNSTLIGKPYPNSNGKNAIKAQRIRPISYPNNYNDRLEWDYRHTLSLTGCHKENGSHLDLDSVDEQTTKNLTEFGENYELWFGKEDEIACVPLHSRPPSVEPAEKPEIAKAVVTSNSSSPEDINCKILKLSMPSSLLSVPASNIPRQQMRKHSWQLLLMLITIVVVIISGLCLEPHQLERTYRHTQPPV